MAIERSGCIVGSPPKKITLALLLLAAKAPSHDSIVDMGRVFSPCCSLFI
jgi:hypothetical protein